MSYALREPAGGAPIDGRHLEQRLWTKGGPVDSELLLADDVTAIEEKQEASMGEPAAMALYGFAVGTFIIAWPISGFVPTTTLAATIAPVLIFAGVAQFLGGMVAFRRTNAFAGTAFCAFGANNVVVATFLLMQALGLLPTTPGSPQMKMLALELYCFGYIALVLAVGALRLNVVFAGILFTLTPGFVLAGMGNWYGTSISPFIGHLGGYFLIASAALAAYAASAMVLNSTWQRPVLPLVPLHQQQTIRPPAVRAAPAGPTEE